MPGLWQIPAWPCESVLSWPAPFSGPLSGSDFLQQIAGTGSITIPDLEKRSANPAHYAGAIEACASTCGVVMPPVMGGGICLCHGDHIGVDYATVMIAGDPCLPVGAVYYFGLILQSRRPMLRAKGWWGLKPEHAAFLPAR